jgi:hypothetical protein
MGAVEGGDSVRVGDPAPSAASRGGLACVLAGVVAASAAVAAAGEASRPEALFARAVDVPISSVLKVSEIEVDRAVVGVLGRYERDGSAVAAIVGGSGDQVARLGRADDAWFAGIVDLQADGRLTSRRQTPRRLRSAGLRRPALVFFTRAEEAIARDPRMGSVGSRGAGIRRETHIFLVELDGSMRVLLDLETAHRSEDGFGGHDVGGLALRQWDGKTYLEGVRQDRLPASRARCLEPEPYPVRFELTRYGFRKLSEAPQPPPCG